MKLKLRSDVMTAKDEDIIYTARNLVCDGATAFDTGFKPFSHENINRDFMVTIRVSSFMGNASQVVIAGCKYEGTIGGQSYPGIYFRRYNATSQFEVGGYNYWRPQSSDVIGRNLYIWRRDGRWYSQVEGQTAHTLSVRSTEFNQSFVIGAGVQTGGTYFRYSVCVIDYVRIEYITSDEDPSSQWDTLVNNRFYTYANTVGSNGVTFNLTGGGNRVVVVTNGKNANTSLFFLNPKILYEDIKDKTCRFIWEIDCDDASAFTPSDGAGNITFGLFTNQTATNLNDRKSKLDYATLAGGNLLGYHEVEFIPSEVMAGLTEAAYFGWNIGFRSAVNGLTITIKEIRFEVVKD